MNAIEIQGRVIAPGNPVFVIAEIGVNHDGSLAKALELVEIAAAAGADAVKLQIFQAKTLVHGSAKLADYQAERVTDSDPAEMLERYELPAVELAQIVSAIRKYKMVPLATPFSLSDISVIEALNLPAIKIASPDCVNYPLLQAATKNSKPLLISTGAATMGELLKTASWLEEWSSDYAFLHCVSSYPAPAQSAHLGWILQLAEAFDVPVGYSDHTTQIISGALAVAAGACVVEKHLTYNRRAQGPDHSASSDPAEFDEYVRLIREAETMLGRGSKKVLTTEENVRALSRQSLVAARDLPAGHVIAESDLIIQRPGTGISAADYLQTIGERTSRAIPASTILQPDMLASALKHAA
ncbi:MAG TPA: N-acetylneuraminate synthase family protein [Tepidisphaeraceae bacterium]|jgi:N-acetylneuraminate synthase/N,N'-diacetyllegionaminate synthase